MFTSGEKARSTSKSRKFLFCAALSTLTAGELMHRQQSAFADFCRFYSLDGNRIVSCTFNVTKNKYIKKII